MRIIGIDPGYGIMGYSILDYDKGTMKVIKAGAIKTKANPDFPGRLLTISNTLKKILKEYKPDEAAIETLYFNQNTKTAINVAQTRGVILLALKEENIEIAEYTPLQVKQAVTGYGRADKKQVQQMVKSILRLKEIPKLDDTTDAMAMSICHAHCLGNSLQKYLKTKG